jgi:hypothetical protein
MSKPSSPSVTADTPATSGAGSQAMAEAMGRITRLEGAVAELDGFAQVLSGSNAPEDVLLAHVALELPRHVERLQAEVGKLFTLLVEVRTCQRL